MTTTIHVFSALVTSIDKNGIERNLILRRMQKSTYKIHHNNFISVNATQISREEYDRLEIPTYNDREINLNDLYNV